MQSPTRSVGRPLIQSVNHSSTDPPIHSETAGIEGAARDPGAVEVSAGMDQESRGSLTHRPARYSAGRG